MWKQDLEGKEFEVIYLNAWETDFEDEPLVPIIGALLDGIATGKGIEELKFVLQGPLGALVLVGNSVLAHASGININANLKPVSRRGRDRGGTLSRPFKSGDSLGTGRGVLLVA